MRASDTSSATRRFARSVMLWTGLGPRSFLFSLSLSLSLLSLSLTLTLFAALLVKVVNAATTSLSESELPLLLRAVGLGEGHQAYPLTLFIRLLNVGVLAAVLAILLRQAVDERRARMLLSGAELETLRGAMRQYAAARPPPPAEAHAVELVTRAVSRLARDEDQTGVHHVLIITHS